ncbi:MAG: hypothetical protein QM811_26870 [Pirellulales bacterium]
MLRRFEITTLPSTGETGAPTTRRATMLRRDNTERLPIGRNTLFVVGGALAAGVVLGWLIKRRV